MTRPLYRFVIVPFTDELGMAADLSSRLLAGEVAVSVSVDRSRVVVLVRCYDKRTGGGW